MNILGIDPGPTACGVVIYDLTHGRVLWSRSDVSVKETLRLLLAGGYPKSVPLAWPDVVVIERVESYGISGGDLLRTAEVVGRLAQRCMDYVGTDPVLLPRRQVCRALGIVGKGKDAQVREAMLARHGGTKAAAVGTKKAPGPLYGVSGHAWQALGLVVAWDVLRAAADVGGAA